MRISFSGGNCDARTAAALQRPELGVDDRRYVELPRREPLAQLGERGAQHATLLGDRRGAEPLARRLLLRGEPRLAALLGQQPRVAVAGKDDVLEQVAHSVDHCCAPARVEPGHTAAQASTGRSGSSAAWANGWLLARASPASPGSAS